MIKHIASLAVLAAAATGIANADQLNMKAGQWDVIITTSIMGQDFTDTFSECMSYEDAGLTGEQLAREYSSGAGCTAENIVTSGNKIDFDMACSDPIMDGTHMTAIINYTDFNMSGAFNAEIEGMGTIPGTITLDGQHTGTCS